MIDQSRRSYFLRPRFLRGACLVSLAILATIPVLVASAFLIFEAIPELTVLALGLIAFAGALFSLVSPSLTSKAKGSTQNGRALGAIVAIVAGIAAAYLHPSVS